MNILVVKYGALGDVVRTSYFVDPLRKKYGQRLALSWITASGAVPLIARNPHIDRILTSFNAILSEEFDTVYSLDDEVDILKNVARLQAKRIVGAYEKG